MTGEIAIALAPGAEELGLAAMLQGMIEQNIEAQPAKGADFRKLNLNIGLKVPDADIEMVMEFRRGSLTIHAGLLPQPDLLITADSEIVMSLSNQKIKWGLPYYFDDTGREIFRAMTGGRLQVKGLRHFPSLVRFSRVMSVH